jgi:5-formyltetrahydrofolate cyclo-ligase
MAKDFATRHVFKTRFSGTLRSFVSMPIGVIKMSRSYRTMNDPISASTASRKKQVRQQARAARAAVADKDGLSRRIMANALALPEYDTSQTAMLYVDVRHEVRTRFDLPGLLQTERRIVVPYCDGKRLGLFHLHQMSELAPGRFGVLEPGSELRSDAGHAVAIDDIDLVFTPGVAFDRHGGRMGHGRGYYDRLLSAMPARTVLVGLAFECQVFPDIPTELHDISMDRVVTESTVYVGRGH